MCASHSGSRHQNNIKSGNNCAIFGFRLILLMTITLCVGILFPFIFKTGGMYIGLA